MNGQKDECDKQLIWTIQIRKKLKIGKIIRQKDFKVWIQCIKSMTIILIHRLDEIFFKQLNQMMRLNTLKKGMDEEQLKKCLIELLQIVKIKLTFYQVLVQYVSEKNKQQSSYVRSFYLKQIFHPQLLKIINFCQTRYRRKKGATPSVKPQFSDQDQAFLNFLKYKITKINKPALIQLKIPQEVNKLSFFINQSNEYDYKEFLQKIIFHVKKLFTSRNFQSNQNRQKRPTDDQLISQNIDYQQFPDTMCINCAQFLYKKFLYQRQRNCLREFLVFESSKNIKKDTNIIIQLVNAIMNSNGHATLLFDSKQTIFGFQAIGQRMNLKEQEGYKQTFDNLMKSIEPEVKKRSLIKYEIDFVPLKKSPYDSKGQLVAVKSERFRRPAIQRFYQSDLSVMRVKFTNLSYLQFYGCKIDKNNYQFVLKNHKAKEVKGQEFYHTLKEKQYRFTFFKTVEQIKRVQKIYDQQYQQQILKGRKMVISNLHQGHCKETLILTHQ